jgi:hypothetical protein
VRNNALHGKGRLIMSTKKPVSPTLKDANGAVISRIIKSIHNTVYIHVDTRGLTGDDVEVTAYFNILTNTKWAETKIWTSGTTELKFGVVSGSYGSHVGKNATIYYSINDGKSDELSVPIAE